MISNLIKLLVLFLVGWLIYTQVLGRGTEAEKQQGAELIENGKNVLSSVFGIISNEGQKFKDGTYDDAIDKLGSLLDDLRSKTNDSELQAKLDELKQEEERIKKEITEVKQDETTAARPTTDPSEKEAKTEKDLKKLTEDIQTVLQLMSKK
jgi:Zn-dependent M32 family carboxypeptidase